MRSAAIPFSGSLPVGFPESPDWSGERFRGLVWEKRNSSWLMVSVHFGDPLPDHHVETAYPVDHRVPLPAFTMNVVDSLMGETSLFSGFGPVFRELNAENLEDAELFWMKTLPDFVRAAAVPALTADPAVGLQLYRMAVEWDGFTVRETSLPSAYTLGRFAWLRGTFDDAGIRWFENVNDAGDGLIGWMDGDTFHIVAVFRWCLAWSSYACVGAASWCAVLDAQSGPLTTAAAKTLQAQMFSAARELRGEDFASNFEFLVKTTS